MLLELRSVQQPCARRVAVAAPAAPPPAAVGSRRAAARAEAGWRRTALVEGRTAPTRSSPMPPPVTLSASSCLEQIKKPVENIALVLTQPEV